MKIQLLLSFPFFVYMLLHLQLPFSSHQFFPKSLNCPLQLFHIHFNKLFVYTLILGLHGVNRLHLLLAAWFQPYAFIFFPHQLWKKARGLPLCYLLVHSINIFQAPAMQSNTATRNWKEGMLICFLFLTNQGSLVVVCFFFFPDIHVCEVTNV